MTLDIVPNLFHVAGKTKIEEPIEYEEETLTYPEFNNPNSSINQLFHLLL